MNYYGSDEALTQNFYIYTYGSPRVGNPAFSKWYHDTILANFHARVVYESDPVAFLPWKSVGETEQLKTLLAKYEVLPSEWCHVGTEIWYHDTSKPA
jgi:hypothetical protein